MTAKQQRAERKKLLNREIEVLTEIADDAKFPVAVEQVRRISVKRVRDRAHRDVVLSRCREALARLEAQEKKPTQQKPEPEKAAA